MSNLIGTIDLTKYIEQRWFGARPHIRGRRIPIAVIIAYAQSHHLTIDEIAQDFALSTAEVLAALLYYEEYRQEIDAQEVADQATFDHLHDTWDEK